MPPHHFSPDYFARWFLPTWVIKFSFSELSVYWMLIFYFRRTKADDHTFVLLFPVLKCEEFYFSVELFTEILQQIMKPSL